MPTFTIEFCDTDTVPERVHELARQHGVDEQTMLKRLIVTGLDGYGLSRAQGEDLRDVTTLQELAENIGAKSPSE